MEASYVTWLLRALCPRGVSLPGSDDGYLETPYGSGSEKMNNFMVFCSTRLCKDGSGWRLRLLLLPRAGGGIHQLRKGKSHFSTSIGSIPFQHKKNPQKSGKIIHALKCQGEE